MTNDVTIIGAGPAGSVAAILLARRGRDVRLIEQHRFPRDKVCGECLSALGIEVLDRISAFNLIRALRPTLLRRNALVAPSGEHTEFALPRPMWGISRMALDTALLDEARRAGATVMQPARVEAIDEADGMVTVRNLMENRVSEWRSAHVMLADGKSALGEQRPPPTGDLGVKAHFASVADRPDTISLFGVRGHYVGLAPIEGGRWDVAMSVPAARVRGFQGRLDDLFEQTMRENRGLAERFRDAERVNDWLAAPLPRFAVRRSWPPNIIPIGNAAAALEPVGGEGMGLAMRSAEMAAEAIDEALRRGVACDVAPLRRAFHRLWRARRATARGVAIMLSSPRTAAVAVDLLRHNDRLAAPALATLGK